MIKLIQDDERMNDFSECYAILRDDGVTTGHWLVAYWSSETNYHGVYIYRFAYVNLSGNFSWIQKTAPGEMPDPYTFTDRDDAARGYIRYVYHTTGTGFLEALRRI